MIAYVKGPLVSKGLSSIIIEAGGIGYELAVSSRLLSVLPPVGESVQVWTYLQVRDDGFSLFGFESLVEKDMFESLIGVSGIGPKMAISALSTFSAQELAACIMQGDIASIATVPGIGKKTAQRVVLELKGILAEDAAQDTPELPLAGAQADAVMALESMGFSASEAAAALKDCTESDVSAIVRYALKNLGGKA